MKDEIEDKIAEFLVALGCSILVVVGISVLAIFILRLILD